MVELEEGLFEELKELGVPFEVPLEKLPSGAKPLTMKGYYSLDIGGRSVIFETVPGHYRVRSMLPASRD